MSSEDKDLAAVMLPRDLASRFASGRTTVGDYGSLRECCKRALRPEPPSRMDLGDLGCGDVTHFVGKRIAEWIGYVLEHGWEPNHD